MNPGDKRSCPHCKDGIQTLRIFDLIYWCWFCKKCGKENLEQRGDK